MPTFKHPCPHCSKYIARDVAACPFCGTRDPFAPARCPNCSTLIEDRAWVSCPRCGQALARPAQPTAAQRPPADQPDAVGGQQRSPATATAASPAAGTCSGCGAPMAAGARFCTVCGTLAGA